MQIMNELFKTNYFIIRLFKKNHFMTYFLSKNKLLYRPILKDILWNLFKVIYMCLFICVY